MEKDFNEQEKLLKDFIKSNLETTKSGGPGSPVGGEAAAKAQAETLKSLNEELKRLQEERENIDLKDIARLKKNEAEQRAIQARIAQFDIKSRDAKAAKDQKQADKDEKDREKQLKDQEEFRKKVLEGELSLIEQEKLAHQRRLEQAGIFGKERAELTEEELKVLQALEKQHYANLNKLDAEALKIELAKRQQGFEDRLRDLRIQHNEEFKEIKTIEQAKLALQGELSNEALNGLRNMKDAQRELDKKYRREEEAMVREHLENLMAELQAAMDTGTMQGASLSDAILSEEEQAILLGRLNEVRQTLSELGLGSGTEIAEDRGLRAGNVDILGFSKADWDVFFDNLSNGRAGVEEMVFATQALSGIWQQYNAMVAAGEQEKMQKFEADNRARQDALKRQLDANIINQDTYNQQVEKMNADLERKKAVLERNRAMRERNVALMSAIVNTAAGVAKSLPNLFLAKLVGILGGLQVGTILKTPLPSIPGAEDGGKLVDVRRSQDNKMFRAKYEPTRRGFIGRPTVIVGENGEEMVASARAVRNPTVKPVLDAIDTAQRNGTIDTLNLYKILEQNRILSAAIPGRVKGGRMDASTAVSNPVNPSSGSGQDEIKAYITQSLKVLTQLSGQLENPIMAEVVLTGKKGLVERQKELSDIEKSANL